jgi:transcriptional antiterminator RfaH
MNTTRLTATATPQHDFSKPLPGSAAGVDVAADLAWFIVVTNVRAERRAAKGLERKGLVSYLPLQERLVVRSRRRVHVAGPLMPRYLFVGFKPTDSFWALRSVDGVESVVRFDGEPVRVPVGIIAAFVEREMNGEFDETARKAPQAAFKAGQVVEVVQGPFSALVATVAHCKPGERVHLIRGAEWRWQNSIDACRNRTARSSAPTP